MFRHPGFTLIELLVVVTIIVVLLALLTPALDQAIYQAELSVCGARVRGIASGATIYATDFKRSYPIRQHIVKNKAVRPNKLWLANGSNPPYDERALIRPYVASINKQFQCPMVTEMELDVNDLHTRAAGESGWASYQFWYGWRWVDHKGMNKLGDRFIWTANGKEYQFDILANDYDFVSVPQEENFAIGSHPDKRPYQTMVESMVNNDPYVSGAPVPGVPRGVHVWSRWVGPYYRGTIDMNFARADNSVSRVNDVLVEQAPGVPEERMARVPEDDRQDRPHYQTHLPVLGR
jgi:prepilin-type N-terminal cleavage/methylation domain-containing protein